MLELLLIFAAQFSMVFLLGFQNQNVIGKHYIGAAITSTILGVSGFYITATIAQVGKSGVFSPEWWAYIAAGPIAIVLSMLLHPKIKNFINKGK